MECRIEILNVDSYLNSIVHDDLWLFSLRISDKGLVICLMSTLEKKVDIGKEYEKLDKLGIQKYILSYSSRHEILKDNYSYLVPMRYSNTKTCIPIDIKDMGELSIALERGKLLDKVREYVKPLCNKLNRYIPSEIGHTSDRVSGLCKKFNNTLDTLDKLSVLERVREYADLETDKKIADLRKACEGLLVTDGEGYIKLDDNIILTKEMVDELKGSDDDTLKARLYAQDVINRRLKDRQDIKVKTYCPNLCMHNGSSLTLDMSYVEDTDYYEKVVRCTADQDYVGLYHLSKGETTNHVKIVKFGGNLEGLALVIRTKHLFGVINIEESRLADDKELQLVVNTLSLVELL